MADQENTPASSEEIPGTPATVPSTEAPATEPQAGEETTAPAATETEPTQAQKNEAAYWQRKYNTEKNKNGRPSEQAQPAYQPPPATTEAPAAVEKQVVTDPNAPTLEQFDGDEAAWGQASYFYNADKAEKIKGHQGLVDSYHQSIAVYAEKDPKINEYHRDVNGSVTGLVGQAVMESEHKAQLVKHIAINGLQQKLNGLTPIQLGKEIANLEATMPKDEPVHSDAPDITGKPKTTTVVGGADTTGMTGAEYRAHMAKVEKDMYG